MDQISKTEAAARSFCYSSQSYALTYHEVISIYVSVKQYPIARAGKI